MKFITREAWHAWQLIDFASYAAKALCFPAAMSVIISAKEQSNELVCVREMDALILFYHPRAFILLLDYVGEHDALFFNEQNQQLSTK